MARKYAAEVFEAIWAQLCEGKGPSEIKRLLVTDSAGVGYPVPIADRTLSDYIAKLKRERGHPHMKIRAGEEEDAALAIVRRSLEALAREQQNLTTKQKLGETLSADELKRLGIVGQFAGSLRSKLESVSKQQQKQQSKAGELKHVAASPLLARLSSELKQESVTQQSEQNGTDTEQQSNTDRERNAEQSTSQETEQHTPLAIPVMRARDVVQA